MWRSLVARVVRDDEVAGSNPVIPTDSPGHGFMTGALSYLQYFAQILHIQVLHIQAAPYPRYADRGPSFTLRSLAAPRDEGEDCLQGAASGKGARHAGPEGAEAHRNDDAQDQEGGPVHGGAPASRGNVVLAHGEGLERGAGIDGECTQHDGGAQRHLPEAGKGGEGPGLRGK